MATLSAQLIQEIEAFSSKYDTVQKQILVEYVEFCRKVLSQEYDANKPHNPIPHCQAFAIQTAHQVSVYLFTDLFKEKKNRGANMKLLMKYGIVNFDFELFEHIRQLPIGGTYEFAGKRRTILYRTKPPKIKKAKEAKKISTVNSKQSLKYKETPEEKRDRIRCAIGDRLVPFGGLRKRR